MRVRDFYIWQAGEFDFLWKSQMLLGVLLVLTGVLIAVFPALLWGLVAAGIIMVGASLVGSAWRLRRLERRARGFSASETFEW